MGVMVDGSAMMDGTYVMMGVMGVMMDGDCDVLGVNYVMMCEMCVMLGAECDVMSVHCVMECVMCVVAFAINKQFGQKTVNQFFPTKGPGTRGGLGYVGPRGCDPDLWARLVLGHFFEVQAFGLFRCPFTPFTPFYIIWTRSCKSGRDVYTLNHILYSFGFVTNYSTASFMFVCTLVH